MTSSNPDPGPRPLRADALRNQQRILTAARAAFAEDGLETPLEDIAKRAGVAPATLYRRFPSRDDLLVAIWEQRFQEELDPALTAAADHPDPWAAFVDVVAAAMRMWSVEQDSLEALRRKGALMQSSGLRLFETLRRLLERCQQAGRMRTDLTPDDLPVILRMASVAVTPGRSETHWRRYLDLLLDALRAPADRPDPR
ncbi:helix-turn-helix domain-containing protein [Kitasatospora sp. NPDC001539]|uniref:TetR/AcrR family transcriptional regulator n=1 Tax=Kitasatospora sp. NPDC001539 TaxID=3154384 RepID=UPI003320744B